jgi:hypothetical protein
MVTVKLLTLLFGTLLMLPALAVSAGETTYTSRISPLFKEKCSSCHGLDAPEYGEFEKNKEKFIALSKGPRMDSYPHLISFIGWPDSGAIMRRLDDGKNKADGNPGNMYKHLGSSEEERQKNLALFKDWIGMWNLKKWPDVTKEEMNLLKVKY